MINIGLKTFKKIINSNKHTKAVAVKVKKGLIRAIGTNEPRELYNLSSFYPSIQEYYGQTKDIIGGKDPLFSILLPTYNTPELFLRECIESIIIQSYPKWELCIADDDSTDKNVVKIIEEYIKKDSRIKLIKRVKNGHISEATNSALGIATGDFVALMDHDDVLWPNALFEIANVIRKNKSVDFVYSDEDKIDGSGKIHSYPFLKPDFSPEFLESCNYITHFSCMRMSIIKKVGGLRKGYEGAQDWDLFIRISEITNNFIHIPKILYSWRIHEASTASSTDAKPYVYEAQKKLLVDHIERTGMKGVVETGIIPQHRTIKYEIEKGNDLTVVVFISDLLKTKRLINSLNEYKPGVNYALLYCYSIDISKDEQSGITKIIKNLQNQKFMKISQDDKYHESFGGISTDSILYIEDNVTVVVDNWAKIFLADSQRPGVGVVGPVLLDVSKNMIISAGVGVGYGKNGFLDMLAGMPFDDPHYSRGLYAKSRRNVTAVNPSVFAVKKEVFMSVTGKTKNINNIIDKSEKMIEQGYRNIYTPYVQFVTNEIRENNIISPTLIKYEDKFLNPNFNHDNGRMEVRP